MFFEECFNPTIRLTFLFKFIDRVNYYTLNISQSLSIFLIHFLANPRRKRKSLGKLLFFLWPWWWWWWEGEGWGRWNKWYTKRAQWCVGNGRFKNQTWYTFQIHLTLDQNMKLEVHTCRISHTKLVWIIFWLKKSSLKSIPVSVQRLWIEEAH